MPMKIQLKSNLPISPCHECNKGNTYWADWYTSKRDKTVKFTSQSTGMECVAFPGEYTILKSENYGKSYSTKKAKL